MVVDILIRSLRDVWHGTNRLRVDRPFHEC